MIYDHIFCRDEYVSVAGHVEIEDITSGKEMNPIPAINIINTAHPAPLGQLGRLFGNDDIELILPVNKMFNGNIQVGFRQQWDRPGRRIYNQ